MDTFDPYHQWLGIPPHEQPPDHYQLLGIPLFESSASVIANAADQRMSFLKSVQIGEHIQFSQDLLNRVAQAKLCLLHADKKSDYDEALRKQRSENVKKSRPVIAPRVTSSPPPSLVDTSPPRHRQAQPAKRLFSTGGILALLAVAGILAVVIYVMTTTTVNNPPTLDPMVNVVIDEDDRPQTVQLAGIGSGEDESQSLAVTATSSNRKLIANPRVTQPSLAATASLTFQPLPDRDGRATITVTVEDGGTDDNLDTPGDNASFNRTFDVTVHPVNDPPTLDPILDLTIPQNSGPQTIELAGIDAGGHESQSLAISVTSSNPGVTGEPEIIYNSAEVTGSLTFTPLAGQSGRATITVTVEDDGLENNLTTGGDKEQSSQSFVVTVRPPPKPPVITVPGPQQTDTNLALQFSDSGSNQISIRDAAGGNPEVEITLEATRGLLTLDHRAQVSRTVSFLTGNRDKTARIQVLGKLQAINAAISSLSFLPAEGYEGDASITITTQVVAMAGRVDIRPNTETITIAVRPPAPDPQIAQPNETLLKERIGLIREKHADAYKPSASNADKSALAKTLIAAGAGPAVDRADQFAYFQEARELATGARDSQTAFRAVDELQKRFALDALSLKSSVLKTIAARRGPPEERLQLAGSAISLLDEALQQDRFDVGTTLLQVAKKAAPSSRNPAMRKRVAEKDKEFQALKKEFSLVSAARVQLKEDPTDAEANLTLGKYYCFTKGQWEQGLPMLAGGSDVELKQLATGEIAGPADPAAMAGLADDWWRFAEKKKKRRQPTNKIIRHAQLRAAHWYQKSLPGLDDPARATALQRLEQLVSETNRSGPFATRGKDRSRNLQQAGGTEASEAAVESALQWFVRHQRSDGGWSFDHSGEKCQGQCNHPGTLVEARIGATAMGLLPFFGAGHTHQSGTYREQVQDGLSYLLRSMNTKSGNLWEKGGTSGTMYSQGLATIVLCEAYGMTKDKTLKSPAQMALNYLTAAQSADGGWPNEATKRGDTSMLSWVLMALKTGGMADLNVSPTSFQGASRFLDSVQSNRGATYGDQDPDRSRKATATTAIGLLCRMHLGWKRDNEALQRGVQAIGNRGPATDTGDVYYNYYATQLLRHYGGNEWNTWNQPMREHLITRQDKSGHPKGSWSPVGVYPVDQQGGRHYCTSLSTLILEVYYRVPPIYHDRATDGRAP